VRQEVIGGLAAVPEYERRTVVILRRLHVARLQHLPHPLPACGIVPRDRIELGIRHGYAVFAILPIVVEYFKQFWIRLPESRDRRQQNPPDSWHLSYPCLFVFIRG
jgi:hypothetical protein